MPNNSQLLHYQHFNKKLKMKNLLFLTLFFTNYFIFGQTKTPPTIKEILLNQLKTTHNKKDWFVPINDALAGLTPEQANWKDGSGNHSVGQLATHLIFWNSRELANFKGEKLEKFNGNNDETFTKFDKNSWTEIVKKIDILQTDWEKAIENADEEKLKSWYETIANISTHNAYHTGQIIFVRKLQGSWNAEKGVK